MKRFHEWLVPELRREPDEDRQWAAFRYAMRMSWMDWWMAGCIPLATLPAYFLPIRTSRIGLGGVIVYMLSNLGMSLVVFCGALAIGISILRTNIRRKARERLRSDNMPICVPCGYDLTGNTNGICPECGAAGSIEHKTWKAG